MSSAVRRFVPLKTACSMKWQTPFQSAGSWREPRRTPPESTDYVDPLAGLDFGDEGSVDIDLSSGSHAVRSRSPRAKKR